MQRSGLLEGIMSGRKVGMLFDKNDPSHLAFGTEWALFFSPS